MVIKWSQHTSNLQEGNAVLGCIPANRRLSNAAASRGEEHQSPLRKPPGVQQLTMVPAVSHFGKYLSLCGGEKKFNHQCPLVLHLGHCAQPWVASVTLCGSAVQPADRVMKSADCTSALLGFLPLSTPASGLDRVSVAGAGVSVETI